MVCALVHRGYYTAAVQVLGVVAWHYAEQAGSGGGSSGGGGEGQLQLQPRVSLEGQFGALVNDLLGRVARAGLVKSKFRDFRRRLLAPLGGLTAGRDI
jgi:hypothetical protein